MSLEITTLNLPDTVMLRLVGRLDAYGAGIVTAHLDALTCQLPKTVILLFRDVSYLSSAGIRSVMVLHKAQTSCGGTLLIAGLQPFCQSVFEMSGLTGVIPIYEDEETALHNSNPQGYTVVTPSGTFTFHHIGSSETTIDIMGDITHILDCAVTEATIAHKPFFETEYSLGAGAMGAIPEDYLPVIGEAMMVAGALVWLPTDGHDTPDYMIPRKASTSVVLQTAFNASIRGGFNDFVIYDAGDKPPATVRDIYRVLFDQAATRHSDFRGVIGLAMRAEIEDAYSAGITKSPLLVNRPANGLPITAPENFAAWFEFDKIPRNVGATALICGAGADMDADLSRIDEDLLRRMVWVNPANAGGQREVLHNHAVFFRDAPPPLGTHDMDVEARHVVDNGTFADMRHLLDQTTIRKGQISVSYIQHIREDLAR